MAEKPTSPQPYQPSKTTDSDKSIPSRVQPVVQWSQPSQKKG
jgi:hypothetical protein